MDQKLFNQIRVLLVDDDEDDYLIIKQMFASMKSSPFILEWISDSKTAIKAIKESRHDAYLVDYRLDALTGLDVLRKVNAFDRPEPFILLTGVGDRDIEFESIQLAASDYIVKRGLNAEVLSRTLYYALGRKEIERHKIEQLIEINNSKDEFISIASHQLRTPATAVKQYVSMVLDGYMGEITEKQRATLQRAYDGNERQLTIVNDLLKVAQIDAGGMELVINEVDVSSAVTRAVEDLRQIVEERQQKLVVTIEEGLHASIDENSIRMVIDNLIDNASKYSQPGGEVTVELTRSVNDFKLKVKDEGVGVSMPDRLFQKFSRIDNPLSTEVGGTGLGLYWARSIARMHKGDLFYQPNQPKGSVFTLSIPN
jgi:two-component system sensor histidine kinase/response regulator